jgi:sugar/nucleoside kinase (ribokinase family)
MLDGAALVYFDGRLAEAALRIAKAARAAGIPVLVEAERLRPGLNELLSQADYVVTSARFPQVSSSAIRAPTGNTRHDLAEVCLDWQAWTGELSLGDAVLSTYQRLPHVKWMVTTLGARGSVFLQRPSAEAEHGSESAPVASLDEVIERLSLHLKATDGNTVACVAANGEQIR